MRPHPLLAAVVASSLLTGPLWAQVLDPTKLVSSAEKLIESKNFDAALSQLWRAEQSLESIPSDTVRAPFAEAIAKLIKKVDPLVADRAAADTAIAKQLAGLAQRYVRKKYYRTALQQLLAGQQFDPKVGAKQLAYVRKRAGANKQAKPPALEPTESTPKDRMREFRPAATLGEWTKTATGWTSPAITDKTVLTLGSKPAHEDAWIRCDIRMTKNVKGWASIIFGARGKSDYFIAEYSTYPRGKDVASTLFYFDGNEAKRLAIKLVPASPSKRQGWRTLDVRVKGKEITVSVDGKAVITAMGPREAHGTVGFFVSGNSPNKAPVEFRNLRIGPLPVDDAPAEPESKESIAARTIADAIAQIESDMKKGRKESAALAARSASRELAQVSPALRESLAATLSGLITQTDPLHAEHNKAYAAIAGMLAGLATRYVEADRPLCGLTVFQRASNYDREVARVYQDRVAAKLAPTLAKLRGLPAEPDEPASNDFLRTTFEKGRTAWGGPAWKFDAEGLHSPPNENGTVLLAEKDNSALGKLRVQTRANGDVRRALVLSYRSQYDFWIAIFDGDSQRLMHYFGNDWQTCAERRVKFSKQAKSSWLSIEAQYDKSKIEVRFGQAEPILIPRPKKFRPGRFGLWVSTGKGTASFRNFSFEPAKPN